MSAVNRRPAGGSDDVRELMRRFLTEDSSEDAFRWQHYTTADGLPHNWVYDLFEDSAGRIWVGTWGGGLAMYDGDRWTRYGRRHGLASKAVTCVREDAVGRIWVATDAGMNRFVDGRLVPAGLTGKSILNLHVDRDQRLWAACWRATRSGGGLFTLDTAADGGAGWQAVSRQDGMPSLEILKIFEDSRGRIWVGTYEYGEGAGVGCWDGSRWRRFSTADGLVSNCVYSMFEDPDGHLWFGTIGGVSVHDGSRWHRLTSRDGLVDDRVYTMLLDRDQQMWFGTEGGVSRYDGTTWTSYTAGADGPVENLVRTIAQDRHGDLWFGSYPYLRGRGGISRAGRPDRGDTVVQRSERLLGRGDHHGPERPALTRRPDDSQ